MRNLGNEKRRTGARGEGRGRGGYWAWGTSWRPLGERGHAREGARRVHGRGWECAPVRAGRGRVRATAGEGAGACAGSAPRQLPQSVGPIQKCATPSPGPRVIPEIPGTGWAARRTLVELELSVALAAHSAGARRPVGKGD